MDDPHAIGYLVADLIYLLLTLTAGVLFFLYLHAWKKMKRSPMIRSVWVLMLAISVDSAVWTVTTIAHVYHPPIEEMLLSPMWLIVTKLVFLFGLLCFFYATLSPSKEERVKRVKDIQRAGDISTLPLKKQDR